jgi:hypothetical protein
VYQRQVFLLPSSGTLFGFTRSEFGRLRRSTCTSGEGSSSLHQRGEDMLHEDYACGRPGSSTLSAETVRFGTLHTQLLPKTLRHLEPLGYADLPPEVSPDLHPYILRVRDDHLAPQTRSGDQIPISANVALRRGMIVAIFPRHGNAALKRLVAAPPPKPWVPAVRDGMGSILILSQDHPRRVYHLPTTSVEDVHGAIGVIPQRPLFALVVML